jgi:DNA-directed RNA polymerase subunit RPC12/RpoP
MSDFEDKNLTCRECKAGFVFTAGEQTFFSEKQLHDPVRCKECRDRRKAEKQVQGY